MVKIFISFLIIFISNLSALELTYAKGDFKYKFGLDGVMDASVNMDVNILSVRENHYLVSKNLYIFGSFDIYNSDTLDDYASYINYGADFSPFGVSATDVASNMGAPVPVSFEMRGIDMIIGIGYDVYKDDKSSVGIGFASGISMPYIQTKNLIQDAELFMAILDKTKTEIMSYKLMPSIQGRYQIIPLVAIEASLSYGYQFGSIKNDYISGDASFSGSVIQSDIAFKFTPLSNSKICFDIGYRYNNWDVESMDITVLDPSFSYDFSQNFDIGFESKFFYFGAGYSF
jgi:hypothetical protein